MSLRARKSKAAAAHSDLRQRTLNAADVLTNCSELEELEDGYALRFPESATWSGRVDMFVDAWRTSCPQMTFEVTSAEGAGSLRLEIRGPEGTKQFVEGARYILTSHLNPAPTFKYKVGQGLRLLSSPLRVLPNFLIIGAKKCGTTALYSYLTQHPSILPARRKEVYYFKTFYGKGTLGRHRYRAFFPTTRELARISRSTGQPALTGEATPDYLFSSHVPRRAFETVPEARLIAILRNPVERAYSFYNHNLRAGVEDLSFKEAIDSEPERLAGEREKVRADENYDSFEWDHHSYVTRGEYVDQLQDWVAHYPKSQILVLRTEDLTEQPEQTLRRSFEFLGLPYHAPQEFKKMNAAPPYLPMDAQVREKLEAHFEPCNRRLSEFLGTQMDW